MSKKEEIKASELMEIANGLTAVIDVVEDGAMWLTLGLTLKDLEHEAKKLRELDEQLAKKHHEKDSEGNTVTRKVQVVDSAGQAMWEEKDGKKEPLMQDVPKIKDPEKYQVERKALMDKKIQVEWKETIRYKDIAQLPGGYKKLQFLLLDRVIIRD